MSGLGIEGRVGAFVLGALGLLVAFVLALGQFDLSPGVRVHADFAYTSGLQVGAPVMMSGIRLGRVTELALLGDGATPPPAAPRSQWGQRARPLVRAELTVEPRAMPYLRENTRLYVGTQGLIGEAYVEVEPPSPEVAGEPVGQGGVLRGVDAPRLHVMTLQLSALLSAAESLLGPGEPGTGEAQMGTLGSTLARLLGHLDEVVGGRREVLGAAIDDLVASAAALRGLLLEARAVMVEQGALRRMGQDGAQLLAQLRRDLPPMVSEARESLSAIGRLTQTANQALEPEAMSEIVQNARTATERLERIAASVQGLVGKIERGEGTVGGLMQDSQIYDDLKEMLRDLKRNPWKFLWRD